MSRAARVALVILTLLLALGFGACGGSTSSLPPNTPVPPTGSQGRLLFTQGASLWTLDLETAKKAEIVTPPELGQVHSARWSPDGTRIVYALYEVRDRRMPLSEIYVATPTGGGATKLLKAEQAATFFQSPVWGPNGSLYYLHVATSGTTRVRQIERMDLASGKQDVVIPEVGAFDVSPDGKWLALVRSDSSGGVSITLTDLATNETREVVPKGPYEVLSSPRFDPTSQTLAFSATRPGGAWSPPADDTLASRLLDLFGVRPALAHGLPQDIWSVPIAGGTPKQMAKIDADEPVVAWSPDGTRVAILSSEYLSSMELSGGMPKPILVPGGYGTVDWAK